MSLINFKRYIIFQWNHVQWHSDNNTVWALEIVFWLEAFILFHLMETVLMWKCLEIWPHFVCFSSFFLRCFAFLFLFHQLQSIECMKHSKSFLILIKQNSVSNKMSLIFHFNSFFFSFLIRNVSQYEHWTIIIYSSSSLFSVCFEIWKIYK